MAKYGLIPIREKIKQLRKLRGWTQQDLADRAGVSLRFVGLAETREEPRRVSLLQCIAEALDCQISDIAKDDRSSSNPPVRVAILRSGDLAYTREITHKLRCRLEACSTSLQREFRFFIKSGPVFTQASGKAEHSWSSLVQTIEKRSLEGRFDYHVAVGTQATVAFQSALGPKIGIVPFIFVGVTYPVEIAIVDNLQDRSNDKQIAGVGYVHGGVGAIASRISELFPDRKLTFIYHENVPQDRLAAEKLREDSLCRRGVLQLKPVSCDPALSDMPDPQRIYFSWYTFETMFEENRGIELLKQRLIVSTTCDNVETPGLSVAAVSVDDGEIGCLGANLVVQHIEGKTPLLGNVPVLFPKVRHWINSETARQHRLTFPQATLATAEDVF